MNQQQQLVFGLETYRSNLVSPKDWNPRLRMSPSSRLFLSLFFPHLTVVFFLSFFCTRNSKKQQKQQQKRPEQQQEEGEIQVMAAGSAKAWPQQLDLTIISTAFSWHSILSSS
jgi:hypothetical protein